jgi:hypothetical protein
LIRIGVSIGIFEVLLCLSYSAQYADLQKEAQQFASKNGKSSVVRFHEISSNKSTHRYFFDGCVVGVDATTKKVNLWLNTEGERGPGTLESTKNLEIIKCASDWAERVGLDLQETVRVTTSKNPSESKYTLTYSDKPGGFEVAVGNKTTIQMSEHGTVLMAMKIDGYVYDKPVVKVTSGKAGELAKQKIRAEFNCNAIPVEVYGPRYGVDASGAIGKRSYNQSFGPKRAYLQYAVKLKCAKERPGQSLTAFVNAKTGQVLTGSWVTAR